MKKLVEEMMNNEEVRNSEQIQANATEEVAGQLLAWL